jgi:hypothetical protein
MLRSEGKTMLPDVLCHNNCPSSICSSKRNSKSTFFLEVLKCLWLHIHLRIFDQKRGFGVMKTHLLKKNIEES